MDSVKQNINTENIQDAVITSETFNKKINELEKMKNDLFDEAIKSGDPEVIQKASHFFSQGKNLQNITGEKIRSLLIDPLDFASSFGYKDKPTRLTYWTLQKMASTPFTAITLNTRINQIIKFCVPQPDEYSVGFKIRLRDRKKSPTKKDLKIADEITQFILDGGFGGYRWGRDDFENFVAKVMRDSLTYDQMTFEVIEDRRGIPHEFIATDASTYRIVFPNKHSASYKSDPLTGQKCLPFYVQLYNGAIEQEFYPWELAFVVRRPRSDLRVSGYGFAELEELVNIITSMLYGDEYNRRFFSQGSAPKGIIKLTSANGINDEALKDFKRQWQMQMSGVYNSWKTPIVDADKFEWVDLQKANKDMEFSNWVNYNIKLHCALFLISPTELGFEIEREGRGGGVFESNTAQRIKYSKDKGLMPLLRILAKSLNRHLIWRINPDFEIAFLGGEENEDDVLEKSIKALGNFATIDETRAKFGLKKLGDENGGNLILNGNYMSWRNNKEIRDAQKQEESESGQDFGEEEDMNYNPLEEENEEYEKANDNELNNNPFVKDLLNFINDINNEKK